MNTVAMVHLLQSPCPSQAGPDTRLHTHQRWGDSSPPCPLENKHYNDVMMSAMASQIIGVSYVCSTVGSGTDRRKYQSSLWRQSNAKRKRSTIPYLGVGIEWLYLVVSCKRSQNVHRVSSNPALQHIWIYFNTLNHLNVSFKMYQIVYASLFF